MKRQMMTAFKEHLTNNKQVNKHIGIIITKKTFQLGKRTDSKEGKETLGRTVKTWNTSLEVT